MSSNRFFKIVVCSLMIASFVVPAFGLKFAGNDAELTVDPNAAPDGYEDTFDIAGELTVWIDHRDEINYVAQIFGTLINDPCNAEYLIDPNAWNAWMIKADGNTVVYNTMDQCTEMPLLRIADVNDINNPVLEDVNIPTSPMSLDLDDGIVAYATQYPSRIYAFDLADPCRTQYIIAEINEPNYLNSNISIDGDLLCWCEQNYDGYYCQLAVANINDLNNPAIQKTILSCPESSNGDFYIYNLDTSGDWLVAQGYYCSYMESIFGIHNYQDSNSNNWDIVSLYAPCGYESGVSPPRIDEPFVVWVTTSYASKKRPTGNLLYGAVVLDNGKAVVSVLKENTDPNQAVMMAEISGNDVVWSVQTYGEEYFTDLFNNDLEFECGDWGLSLADLNHDCKVDFKDFAMFADRWLDCTWPENDDCILGQMRQVGENLFEIDI